MYSYSYYHTSLYITTYMNIQSLLLWTFALSRERLWIICRRLSWRLLSWMVRIDVVFDGTLQHCLWTGRNTCVYDMGRSL